MQQPTNPLRATYDQLGLQDQGVDYDKFAERMNDPAVRKATYDQLGLEGDGVNYDTFETTLGLKKANEVSGQGPLNTSVTSVGPSETSPHPKQRQGVRQNPDGTVSTHLMASSEADGKYYAYPTLFQDEDGSWIEKSNDNFEAFEEAKRRGELQEFPTQEEAQAYAEGSWKENQQGSVNVPESIRLANEMNPALDTEFNAQTPQQGLGGSLTNAPEISGAFDVSRQDIGNQAEEIGNLESSINSVKNVWTRIQGAVPRLKLMSADVFENILGKAITNSWYANDPLNPRDLEQVRSDAYNRLEELESQQLPTKDLLTAISSRDVLGIGAGVIDAVSSLASTAAAAIPTGGAGLFTEMIGDSIYEFNKTKADRLGVSVDELYESGDAELGVPLAVGTFSGALEKIGLKGVKNAITKKLTGATARKVATLANEVNKEGMTEWFQTGADKINSSLAEGDSTSESISKGIGDMFSREGLSAYVMGVAGSAGAAGLGRIANRVTTKSEKTKAIAAAENMGSIIEDLNNPELSPATQNVLQQQLKSNANDIVDAVEIDADIVANLFPETAREVETLSSQSNELQTALVDPAVSNTTKEALQSQADEISDQMDTLINEDKKKGPEKMADLENLPAETQAEIEDLLGRQSDLITERANEATTDERLAEISLELPEVTDQINELSKTKPVEAPVVPAETITPVEETQAPQAVEDVVVESVSEESPLLERLSSSQKQARESAISQDRNIVTPLNIYTPKLYRETSAESLTEFLPNDSGVVGKNYYLSDTENLAKGQGANKGIMLEFDSGDIRGHIDLSKPTSKLVFESGEGEYRTSDGNPQQLKRNLTSISINPDVKLNKRSQLKLSQLEESGWSKTVADNGVIRYLRPETMESAEASDIQPLQSATGEVNVAGEPVSIPTEAVQVLDNENPIAAAEALQGSYDRLTEGMTPEQIESDPELVRLRDKAQSLNIEGETQDAIQERSAEEIPLEPTSRDSGTVEQGIPESREATGTQAEDVTEDLESGAQEEVTRAGDPLRSFAQKVREGKINKLGGFRAGTGFDAVWDGSLEVVALSIEGGAKVADAIEAGLNNVKQTDWYKNLANKKEFDDQYRNHLNQEYQKEAEPVEEPVKKTPSTPEKTVTGITQEQVAATRAGLGLDEYQKTVKTDASIKREAESLMSKGYNVKELISRLETATNVFPTPVENYILKKYISSLEASNNANPNSESLKEINRVSLLMVTKSSDVGRLLRSYSGEVLVEDNLSNFLMDEAKAFGVNTLPQDLIDDLADKYAKGKSAKDAYEEGYKKAVDDYIQKKAKEELDKAKNIVRKKKGVRKTHEEYVSERKAIRDSIRQKLRKARGQANAVPLPYLNELIAISPDIGKYVRSLVEEGVTNLADVIKAIHADLKEEIPDITQNDVRDLIGGKYSKPTQTLDEKSAQLRDLKLQAKLLSKIEALEGGVKHKDPVRIIKRSKEIEDLQSQISEIQKRQREEDNKFVEPVEKTDEQRLEARRKWLTKRIETLQDDLDTGNYLKPVQAPRTLKLDKETQALQDEYIAFLKETNQRRDLALYDQQSKWRKWKDKILNLLGLRRILQTSLDFSMPFRQAVTVTLNPRYVRTTMRSFANMFKGAFNEKAYDRMMFSFKQDPDHQQMVDDGLVLSEVDSADNLKRDEDFRTSFLYRIPYLRWPFLASNRAAAGYVNTARYEIYKRQVANLRRQGVDRDVDPLAYEYAAKWAMNMTGRGNLLKNFEDNRHAQQLLGDTFYGARLMASRFNLLNPNYYIKMPKAVRVEALKDMAWYVSGATVMASAALAAGASISIDPDEPDFLQAKWGNKRYDLYGGGMIQYVRTAFRLTKAIALRLNPNLYFGEIDLSAKDKADKYGAFAFRSGTSFFRYKLAPNTAYLISGIEGKDAMGNDFNPTEILELYPMYAEELVAAVKSDNALFESLSVLLPNIFGIGYNEFKSTGRKQGVITELKANNKTYILSNQQIEMNKNFIDQYKKDNKLDHDMKLEDLLYDGMKRNEAIYEANKWFDSQAKAYAKKEMLAADEYGDIRLVEDTE